jgi:integrase
MGNSPPSPVSSVAGDETVIAVCCPGEQTLPKRGSGGAIDRVAQLTAQIGALLVADGSIDEASFRKAIEARAPASVKALANDLEDYAAYCRSRRLAGLPATEARVVHYIEDCEARSLKPATVARRLASLAVIHSFIASTNPTKGEVVRDAMRGLRRRRGVAQRQAGPIRLGDDEPATAPAKGITLKALLEACEATPTGLRDAALLSLGYDTGLRVSELVAVRHADITLQDDGSAHLLVPRSKADQTGQGGYAWVSPETVRRIVAWTKAAGIGQGALFRRVAVRRFKAHEGTTAAPIRELAWNHRSGAERLGVSPPRSARIEYAIGEHALTPAAVRLIIKRNAQRAADLGHVSLQGRALEVAIATLSSHSLRVGLTQDLFAAGEDAGPIAQALRWSSPTTALRYGRQLVPASDATARHLRGRRS